MSANSLRCVVVTHHAEADLRDRARDHEAQHQEAKAEIARAALDFVEPGQALFVDDSTTVLQFARLLPERSPLTVITNFLPAINEMNNLRGISLVALGGTYYNWCSSFMGQMTIEAVQQLRGEAGERQIAGAGIGAITGELGDYNATLMHVFAGQGACGR